MLHAVVRGFVVSVGWILGVVAGALVLLAVVVAAVWLLTRPPSPESEVRAYLSDRGVGDAVSVEDCRPVQGDSTFDLYRCDLRVDDGVNVGGGDGAVVGLATGTHCFEVPRSGSETDADVELQRFGC